MLKQYSLDKGLNTLANKFGKPQSRGTIEKVSGEHMPLDGRGGGLSSNEHADEVNCVRRWPPQGF